MTTTDDEDLIEQDPDDNDGRTPARGAILLVAAVMGALWLQRRMIRS